MTLLLLALPARAATLSVCDSCDYTDVDSAVANAEAGDEISVAAGSWQVGTTIDLDLDLVGEGEGETVLVSAEGSASVLRVEDASVGLAELSVDGQSTVRGITLIGGALSLAHVTVRDGAGNSGAGLYASSGGAVSASACSFVDNDAGTSSSGGHIAVQDGSLLLDDCSFSGGRAASGGAIWAGDSSLEISGSSFEDHQVDPASGSGFGGAIRASGGSVLLSNSSFSGNQVLDSGAGGSLSLSDTSAELSGVSISGSSAPNGGGLYLNDAEVVLVDVRISTCTATDPETSRGGGIAAFSGSLAVSDSAFSANEAQSSTSFTAGGGIYGNGTDLELVDVALLDNSSAGEASVYGGGLYLSDGDLSATGLLVDGNQTTGEGSGVLGGGVFVRGEGSTVALSDCSMRDNAADYAGGALFTTDGSSGELGSLSIDDCSFEGNRASVGGGLALYGAGDVELSTSRFQDNEAAELAGAVFWRPGSDGARTGALSVADSSFRDNLSSGGGGGLAAYYGNSLELLSVSMVGNSAEDGGGFYVNDVGVVGVAHGFICGNSATADDGGGASLTATGADGSDEWHNNVVAENSAADNGGGVQYYEWLGGLSVVNNSFVGNSTIDNGGGFYGYGASDIELVNNLIAWTGNGDGLYLGEDIGSDAITYNAWYENSASDLGGATSEWGTGNISGEDPGLYSYTPGGDCDSLVFTHDSGGPLADAGDPSILDGDGSRSDIGAYGGTDSDPDDLLDGDSDGWPGAVDCDDDDDAVHPGASEIPYDGKDNDCRDGDACDLDGDGYDSDACDGGTDCDDDDEGINPAAEDLPGDGVDADCDGSDGGEGDGGAGDGGTGDGGAGDGGAGDGGAGDGGSEDGGSTDGGSSDGGSSDGGASGDGGSIVDGGSDDTSSDDTGSDGKDEGCGCASGGAPASGLLLGLLGLLGLRRRD